MRVVYIWLSYFPCQIGKTDLEKIAQQAGIKHDVHILVKKKQDQVSQSKEGNISIHRFFSRGENSLLDDLFYSFYFPFYCLFQIKEVTIFHVYNPYYSVCLLNLLLRICFPKSKITFDIRTWPLKEWIKKKLNYLLITLGHLTASHTIIIHKWLLNNFFWFLPPKITEISLWYTPVASTLLQQKDLSEQKTKIFIYIGSIYPRRWIAHMLESFQRYFLHYPEDKLVIVWGWDDAYYTTLQNTYTMENFVYQWKVPHEDISAYLLTADYGVSYIPQTSYFMDQPPLKTVEYLGHGLPVIATNTNWNKLFVSSTNGILTEDNVEHMVKWLITLRKTFTQGNKLEISKSVESYTRKNIYLQVEKIYQQ